MPAPTVKCDTCGLNFWRHGVDKQACDSWNPPIPAGEITSEFWRPAYPNTARCADCGEYQPAGERMVLVQEHGWVCSPDLAARRGTTDAVEVA